VEELEKNVSGESCTCGCEDNNCTCDESCTCGCADGNCTCDESCECECCKETK
jgi:hypothetical protein